MAADTYLLAFVRCLDGKILASLATGAEDADLNHLRLVLDGLEDLGAIHGPIIQPLFSSVPLATVFDYLRQTVGELIVDAVIAAGPNAVVPNKVPAATVMPVWPFEPDPGGDDTLLVSSARLYGTDLLLEARRVEAATTSAMTVPIPGQDGEYLVFARPVTA